VFVFVFVKDAKHHLTDGSSAEFRALVNNNPVDVFSMGAPLNREQESCTRTTASIIRAPGPDCYKICIDGLSWNYLSVRTIAESQYLARLDLKLPKKMPVRLDGESWRLDTERVVTV
jgi:hypothetical protein